MPSAFVLALGVAVLLGELSALGGLHPLGGVWGSRAFLLLLVLGTFVLSRLLRIWDVAVPPRRLSLAPAIPGLVMVVYALVVRVLPAGRRAEWFLGGDHLRHLLFVPEAQGAGNLVYSEQTYPRAWQTLVTAVWSATSARPNADGLRSLVDLMSTAAWFLPAVLSVITGSVAVHLGRRVGLGDRGMGEGALAVAGLGAAAMVLWPPFLSTYQALGFENSFVGGIVLGVVAVEVLARKDAGLAPLGVVLAGAVVCAHTWQLLLPAVGLAFAVVAWPLVVQGGPRSRVALLVCGLVATLVAAPALVAVVAVIGIQHATDAGVEAPLPVALLLAGLLCSTLLVVRHRLDRPILLLWLLILLPATTGAAVAAWVGIAVTDYYPSKLLWHSAALGLAPLAVMVVQGWRRLARGAGESGTRPVLRLASVATAVIGALALAFALITPAGAFAGAWSSVRGALVLDAVTSPGAGRAQVVWLGSVGDDTIGRILLDFYRAGQTATRTPQPPLDVAEECALLAESTTPTVLTRYSAAAVRDRYSCVPGVRVVFVSR